MEYEKELLETILKALVNNPNAVSVERTVDELGVLLTVTLDPADMGLIIGKAGSTINAIRTIVKSYGMREKKRVNVKLNEPAGRQRFERPRRQLEPVPEFSNNEFGLE